jgi:RimJ/RimL family protein N-acetyltransferase
MHPETTVIRFLTANDASAYWAIRLEALECEPEAFGSSPEEHHALSMDELAARLADTGDNFVVGAFEGEHLVGTTGFFRDKGLKHRHKGHVWGVYVTREVRGKKAGRKMLQAVLDRASAIEGIEQIQLSVTTAQGAAAKLYRSLGFEAYGCERQALKIGDHYVDEDNMVLFITSKR